MAKGPIGNFIHQNWISRSGWEIRDGYEFCLYLSKIMKVLLDIKDSKANFVLELLKNLSFVKAKPLTPQKAELFEDLKEAVETVNLIKQGKLKARSAEDLLDEL
jgi:hypothetical protein